MAHTLAARASSFGAAFCLLSAMAVIALTSSYRIKQSPTEVFPPTVTMAVPEPPKPPPPTPDAHPQNSGDVLTIAPIAPPPTLATASQVATVLAIASQPAEITQPSWARVPRDLARFYPHGALRQNVEGRAVLDCLVSTTGALACAIVSETPAGWGFGAAALQIAGEYRMRPAMRDGAPVEGRYRMAVPFDLR